MGREVRRVPKDWEHPKTNKGYYIPLYGHSFSKRLAEWERGKALWDKGFVEYGGEVKPRTSEHGETFERWDGCRPVESDYMPDWPEEQRTHWQMYENVTEGTPISPVCETAEELAYWLAWNKANAGFGTTATEEQWLAMIRRGWAPSMVADKHGIRSGVEAS